MSAHDLVAAISALRAERAACVARIAEIDSVLADGRASLGISAPQPSGGGLHHGGVPEAILAILSEGPTTSRALAGRLGAHLDTVRVALTRQRVRGRVERLLIDGRSVWALPGGAR